MKLNEIADNPGSRHTKKRVGRGIGSGLGKTAGRGGKGQTARKGGAKAGFEGGQMPIYRRLPKRGFASHFRTEEVRLGDLGQVSGDAVDMATLKAAGLLSIHATQGKVILAGKLARKLTVSGLRVSKGAKAAIEAAGGSVVEFKLEERPRKLPKKEKPKS